MCGNLKIHLAIKLNRLALMPHALVVMFFTFMCFSMMHLPQSLADEQNSAVEFQPIELPLLNPSPEPVRASIFEPEPSQTIFDSSKDWLADYLDSLSGDIDSFFIDSFFSDDILAEDSKGSKAKISFNTRRKIGQPVDYNFGVSIKLELPKVHKRLNLIFESNEADSESNQNNVIQAADNVEYSAALRFDLEQKSKWKVNLDTGIQWQLPPNPFTRLRIRRYFDLAYDVNLRATQEFSWYADEGIGSRTNFRFDKKLPNQRLIRFSHTGKYLLDNDYFDLSSSLTLYHELNTKEALAYTLRASGDDKEHATFYNYGIGIRYRRQVYRDWMYAEVAPELETAREDNYDIVPIIMFRFEALISK